MLTSTAQALHYQREYVDAAGAAAAAAAAAAFALMARSVTGGHRMTALVGPCEAPETRKPALVL